MKIKTPIGLIFSMLIAHIVYSDAMTVVSSTPVQCAVCSGPPVLCERLYRITTCNPPDNYCINHLINHSDGTRTLTRSCGSHDKCVKETLATSVKSQCNNFNPNYIYTSDFDCTFCCNKDNCNVPVRPDHTSSIIG